MSKRIAIIGGGLAGIACAMYLEKHNQNYTLYEASNRIGGRVHSYERKGLMVDRGFQILLPSYSICKKLLNYDSLNLKYYPNGANLITKNGLKWYGKPFDYPGKYKTGLKLKPKLLDYINLGIDVIKGFSKNSKTSLKSSNYLSRRYSNDFREMFLEPFFRGIFLNQEWDTNYNRFRYYLNCFFREGAAVPEKGMQEIPNQMVMNLNPNNIILNNKVEKLDKNVVITANNRITFDHIVIATDMSTFYKLTNLPEPENCWNHEYNYILAKKGPTNLAPLNLVSKPSIISHFNIPTLISPSLAPDGTHFMNVSTFKEYNHIDVENEIKRITNENDWQFAWDDHIQKATPKITQTPRLPHDHISICGDWTSNGSIEGAMESGYKTGKNIIQSWNT